MHCHRLRDEFLLFPADKLASQLSEEAWRHIEICADCKSELELTQNYGQLVHEVSQPSDNEIPSFAEMHADIKLQTQHTVTSSGFKGIVESIVDSCSRALTPRLGYALVALALLVGVATMIGQDIRGDRFSGATIAPESVSAPGPVETIIGYEVKFVGVNRELAENTESISDMLENLEICEASVDSVSCERTCQVSIIGLESAEEAGRVVEAFSLIGNAFQSAEVVPVISVSVAS